MDSEKKISLPSPLGTITLKRLHTPKEYAACVSLQEETWGKGFAERVPASILMVSQKVGGVTAGAFDQRGRMIGFVFGMTGFQKGRPVHWSDLLAVRPKYRNSGLGRILKLYQRELVLASGVEEIQWTYDPLVAKNAHLNLNKLGAEVKEYVVEMYPNSGSKLHRGLGMDRFVVTWPIASERVKKLIEGAPISAAGHNESAPVVNSKSINKKIFPSINNLIDAIAVRVEIPADIMLIKKNSLNEAKLWRKTTRLAFVHYLGKGYKVEKFQRDTASGRCFYLIIHH